MENKENENGKDEHKPQKNRSPSPGIKSTAVVKYTAVQSPVGYARLQCNTDLNLPPSNWSTAIDSYGLKQILTQNSGPSSFRMAHMFPDCVGEVDVISGAECIKKLLKLPYQPHGTVSMMVHRVENTLLLDDFDVYDYLMKSEWSWLKDFFYENILKTMSEQERMMIELKNKGTSGLQLTSKFLCHSIVSLPQPEKEVKTDLQPSCSTGPLTGPFLPEAETRSEIPPNEHSYNRNVLWTFENIQMLIGSDLPIFGGKDRPCVSLRLRDAKEPISVLTGGTEGMENPFTTPVAMLLYRVARNMRMTNRTKHVKELLENAIKLLSEERYPQIVASSHYMLADLYLPATTNPAHPDFKEESENSEEEEEEVPSAEVDSAQPSGSGSQLALQMRGLALHDIGETIRPSYQRRKTKLDKRKGLGIEPLERCGKALQHALKGLYALHHVTINKCKHEERERLKQQIILEEQHPKMANPFEPIKMTYEPLDSTRKDQNNPKEHTSRSRRRKKDKKSQERSSNYLIEKKSNVDKNAILIRKENNVYPTLHEPNRDDNFAWKLHLKTLLYEKICLAYATLAEYSYMREHYGFSLKYIDMASKCQKLLSSMILKKLETFKKQFYTDHSVDTQLKFELEIDMNEEVDEVVTADEFDLDIKLPEQEKESMMMSCVYYKKALDFTADEKRHELLRRLGSVNNELGVRHMNEGQDIFMKYLEEEENKNKQQAKVLHKQFEKLAKDSWDCLNEALEIFEKVNDVPNLALIYCNKGRYMRFKAHCDISSFNNSEKKSLYNKAEEMYQTALKLLGPKETCGAICIRELVCWELSCHTYTRATIMQDRPSRYFNEANEVAEALKHALKCCLLSPGPRQYLYQFRAAMIHHRLGSLYHKQYRETTEEGPKRRTLLNLARQNYEHAANMFASLEEAALYLTVQMEHVAVMETQAENSANLKLKSLQMALQLLRQSHSIMKIIKERDPEEVKDERCKEDEEGLTSEYNLLGLYEARLHHVLKSIIQYCRTRSNKDYERMTDVYKKMYCASLRIKKSEDLKSYAASICDVLDAMDKVEKENS
ncbi:Erythroid differentiation-related factor 1 [Eumeta japonica]|uniref:Erythroid differentiation-related factor 1 n=1 Tax=Eumeta variegata TaxID=151549 RepID=A0A4C1TZE0_EUMVA|nr:Erythroid differentiation-related factor 1 [Eumeta japonica]